jgi:hypothetical protein
MASLRRTQRDVDALVGVAALLAGDIGDQFLVQAPPDAAEIDRAHERAFP